MNGKARVIAVSIVALLGVLVLGSWGGREREVSSEEDVALEPLSIGVMPAVDAAPIFLLAERGYDREEGIELSIEVFTNAQNRQSALQTGQVDGAMSDLVAVAVNVAGGFDIKATTLTDGTFIVLANPGATERERVRVGTMEVSVTNFLIDSWLSERYELKKVFINAIPARLEATVAGQLDMGIFPEPIASVGAMRGLEKLTFEPVDGFSPDVMVFTGGALREKRGAIAAFHRAYDRAVADIVADEAVSREVIVRSVPNVKPELRDRMTLPRYNRSRLPSEEYLSKVIDWTSRVVAGGIEVTPAQLVDRGFVESE